MDIQWIDRPQAVSLGRDPERVREFLAELQANPKRWAVYSEHATRGAARQRIYALKGSANYRDQPLVWRTARVNPGELTSPVRVLVCWDDSVPPEQTTQWEDDEDN